MGKLTFGATGGVSYQAQQVNMHADNNPRCPRCSDRVYFNEEKKALGKSWHTRCFNCAKCKKKLDSTNCNGHESEIYCGACYRKEFGPKSYGFAGEAAGLFVETCSSGRASPSAKTSPVLLVEEQVEMRNGIKATSNSGPSSNRSSPTPSRLSSTIVEEFINAPSANRIAYLGDAANSNLCHECNAKVHMIDQVKAFQKTWHQNCFKCGVCGKLLTQGRCSEQEGVLLCPRCDQDREDSNSRYSLAYRSSVVVEPPSEGRDKDNDERPSSDNKNERPSSGIDNERPSSDNDCERPSSDNYERPSSNNYEKSSFHNYGTPSSENYAYERPSSDIDSDRPSSDNRQVFSEAAQDLFFVMNREIPEGNWENQPYSGNEQHEHWSNVVIGPCTSV